MLFGGVFMILDFESVILRESDPWENLQTDRCILLRHEQKYGSDEHGHDFLELTYLLRGRAEHCIDGTTGALSVGDYLIVDYGSRHRYCNREAEPFENFDCIFLPELLDPALKGVRSLRAVLEHYLLHFSMRSPCQNPAGMIFHDQDGRVLKLLSKIGEELQKREAGYCEMVRCYLVEILLLTMRQMDGVQRAAGEITEQIAAAVAEHYKEPLTLSDLAKQMNYSLPYLSRRFKEENGVGFSRYLQRYRVARACRLLSDTRMSVGEVAEAVGYHDSKSFAQLFKQETGLSPIRFRKHKN